MPWVHYVAFFWAGAFFLNALPHLIHGISGHPFPSPFAKPPGRGLSSPLVNTLWGLSNLAVAAILCQVGGNPFLTLGAQICFFSGFALMAFILANHFGKVASEPRD